MSVIAENARRCRLMVYLTVIIPVRNEERFIGETLAALVDQDYEKERVEILVVDGRSEDATREMVRSFISAHAEVNMRLLDNPGLLSSCARNIGIREARGGLIAVIDAHVHIPNRMLFKDMERLKEASSARCLSRPAPLDVPGLAHGMSLWIACARKTWLGHSQKSHIYGDYEGFVDPVSSGFAYDASVFKTVGFFDETFDAAEDVEFHFRLKKAGILAYTSPQFRIYSYPRETLGALFRQQTRYGDGRARFMVKHPSGLTLETLVPVAIFLAFMLLPLSFLALPFLPTAAFVHLALIGLYAIVVLAAARSGVKGMRDMTTLFAVAAAIWVTHMGLAFGFLSHLVWPGCRRPSVPCAPQTMPFEK